MVTHRMVLRINVMGYTQDGPANSKQHQNALTILCITKNNQRSAAVVLWPKVHLMLSISCPVNERAPC